MLPRPPRCTRAHTLSPDTTLLRSLTSQDWGGLQPCVLCLYQRYAYGVALAFAGLAFLAAAHALGRRILLMLAGLAFAAGSAIAAFHVGVEQKWWEGTAQRSEERRVGKGCVRTFRSRWSPDH